MKNNNFLSNKWINFAYSQISSNSLLLKDGLNYELLDDNNLDETYKMISKIFTQNEVLANYL